MFPSRESQNLLNMPLVSSTQKYFFKNNFSRNDNPSHLDNINEITNDPNSNIEKNTNLHSTKENFSKTTKKLLYERQNSFDKLSNSNPSKYMNSFSFPNLEELITSQPNKASFMDLKAITPMTSNKTSITPLLLNPQYQPTSSMSGFLQNSSLKDFQAIQMKNSKWDLTLPYETNKKYPENSFVNFEYASPKLINNVSSINNLDTFLAHFPSKKNDISDKLLKFALPSNHKTSLNGKFPSMKALESNDLEPVLGKRECQLESRINLPSLKRKLKNPSTGQLLASKNRMSEKIIKENNKIILEANQKQMEKPNSTTSLESKFKNIFFENRL
jgi:hypothetical protein